MTHWVSYSREPGWDVSDLHSHSHNLSYRTSTSSSLGKSSKIILAVFALLVLYPAMHSAYYNYTNPETIRSEALEMTVDLLARNVNPYLAMTMVYPSGSLPAMEKCIEKESHNRIQFNPPKFLDGADRELFVATLLRCISTSEAMPVFDISTLLHGSTVLLKTDLSPLTSLLLNQYSDLMHVMSHIEQTVIDFIQTRLTQAVAMSMTPPRQALKNTLKPFVYFVARAQNTTLISKLNSLYHLLAGTPIKDETFTNWYIGMPPDKLAGAIKLPIPHDRVDTRSVHLSGIQTIAKAMFDAHTDGYYKLDISINYDICAEYASLGIPMAGLTNSKSAVGIGYLDGPPPHSSETSSIPSPPYTKLQYGVFGIVREDL